MLAIFTRSTDRVQQKAFFIALSTLKGKVIYYLSITLRCGCSDFYIVGKDHLNDTVGKDHLNDIARCLCGTVIGTAVLCLRTTGTSMAVGVKTDIVPMQNLVTN